MIINKEVNRKFQKDYFFSKGFIDIDAEYFIEKIKKSCSTQGNFNFKTNIKGLMTDFYFFNNDPKFKLILTKFVDYIDSIYFLKNYCLNQSWGFELRPGERTLFHEHGSHVWSGVIYLNKCDQPLEFPEINEELYPEKGSFALFNGFLNHGNKKNKDTVSKFGLSFNMREVTPW